MGLLIPKEYGGLAASADTFVDVVLNISSACASSGMIFVMHSVASEIIATCMPNSKEKEQLLKAAATGTHLSTLACSERGTGTHFYASYSSSKKCEGGYKLNAEKCFVTSARFADSYVVSTRAENSEDPLNTSLYLVQKEDKGLEFSGTWDGMGLRGNNSASLKLNDCFVPESRLLGESGKGFVIEMSHILPRFLLGTAAVYTAVAVAALEASIEHAKGRIHKHTSDSLAVLPNIRRSIAEMKLSVDTCLRALRFAAAEFDKSPAPEDLMLTLFEAKLLSTKTAKEVCLIATQIGGGIAYSGALPIERFLRDALAGSVMAPTSDLLLDLLGKAALGQELF